MFTEKACAKINLYLHVTGKRWDGYHLLDSLVVFPDIGDELTLYPLQDNSKQFVQLKLTGPFARQLAHEDLHNNLIIKAAYKLREYVKGDVKPVTIQLKKILPVASGIGGGSSDAAATLRLLMRYWNIKLELKELLKIALELGADVPVCLNPVTQRMQGIGEDISTGFQIPSFGMVLVNHGEAVSTVEVFKKRDSIFSETVNLNQDFDCVDTFINLLSTYNNDLQKPAILLNSNIKKVLKEIKDLPNCRLARMSGSGATCFGLFETVEQAVEAAKILSLKHSWWIWGGKGNQK